MILKPPGCLAGEPRGGAHVSSAAYDNIKKQNLTGKHTTTGQGNAKWRRLLMTPMIRACNGSQVCVERLDVCCLSFSRRRRFKKTYHCNSRTQLRCVIHPAETDFTSRFQSRSLTSSFLKIPPPHPLLRDFWCVLFFYWFFCWNFHTPLFFHRRTAEPKTV